MSNTAKMCLYWVTNVILLLAGIAVSLFDIFPIVNTSIFLLGLYWAWAGISAIIRINPYHVQKYPRKTQLAFSATSIGMGLVWVIISFTVYANQAIPMLAVSLPFLVLDFIFFFRNRPS